MAGGSSPAPWRYLCQVEEAAEAPTRDQIAADLADLGERLEAMAERLDAFGAAGGCSDSEAWKLLSHSLELRGAADTVRSWAVGIGES